MSSQENSWEKPLKGVLIIATILPGIFALIYEPSYAEVDTNPIHVYTFPIVIAFLFWPLGLAIAAIMIIIYTVKRVFFWYVLWVIYIILLYSGTPFTIEGIRLL